MGIVLDMAKKIIFLDRDGTIIEDKKYLNDPTQVEYLPDAFEALAKLKNAGYEFVVVTNQSGIPRGKVQVDKMHAIHEVIKNDFKKHQIDFLRLG